MASTAAALGLDDRTRAVLLTADDLGLCHAANVATYEAFAHGGVTSASLLMPAPWAREAQVHYRGEPIGVQLAITAEHPFYHWGSITSAPSLFGGDGGFAASVADALDHADVDEVRRELRAQVERAVLWGFDVTHLAAHADAVLERPEFFDVVLDLCEEFALPLRPSRRSDDELGYLQRELLAEQGVLFPDALIASKLEVSLEGIVDQLRPGVTELIVRPALESRELRALAIDAELRAHDAELVATDVLRRGLEAAGVVVLSWRDLRTAQRALS